MTHRLSSRAFSIGMLAFFLLLGFLSFYLWGREPGDPQTRIVDDAEQYVSIAQSIAKNGTFQYDGEPTLMREPGYPLFLALIFLIFNSALSPVLIIQTLLLGLTGFLVYDLISRYTQRSIALLAGLSIILFPPFAYFAGQFLSETLFLFLTVLSFYCIGRGFRTSMVSYQYVFFLFAGIFMGFAILTRSVVLLFPLFLFIASAFFSRKNFRFATVFFVFSFLVILPWIARNVREFDAPTITTRSGYTLYVRGLRSTYDFSELRQYFLRMTVDSRREILEETLTSNNTQDLIKFRTARELSQELKKQGLNEAEVDAQQQKLGIELIQQNLGMYITQIPIEVIKLNAPSVTTFSDLVPSMLFADLLILGIYILIYLLAFFSIITLFRSPLVSSSTKFFLSILVAYIAYSNLLMSFFDTIPRYNLPLFPIYLSLAAIAIAFMVKKIFRRSSL